MLKTKEQLQEIQRLNEIGDKVEKYILATLTGRTWLCSIGWHKQVYTHDATVGYYYWASFCQRCGHYDNKHSHSIFSIPPLNDFKPITNNLEYLEKLYKGKQ